MKFENKSVAKAESDSPFSHAGDYGYNEPSEYLQSWGTLLQAVVSQAGTYMLTGEFHDTGCGIYKCEGGCNLPGVGELVLMNRYCSFDYGTGKKVEQKVTKLAELITKIVLEWDPNDPIQSMIGTASKHIGVESKELHDVIYNSRAGGVFGGNSLSSFFDRNPFGEQYDNRDYRRFCHIDISGDSKEEVDQMFADEDLGKELYKKLKEKTAGGSPYIMCCSPNRSKEGLGFWINTGRSTQLDGWKTEEEINEFLKSDGKLIDTAEW